MSRGWLFLIATLIVLPLCGAEAAKKPNILWIVSEDNDPFLGCYGDKFAHTPNLDKLATEGILYLNAFANAPVCAPSRSTLITGMYASSLGTQHMRSLYHIPQEVKLLPQYLKEEGYYCSNPGQKTDYNFQNWAPKRTWDSGQDWSARGKDQPFFCTFNSMITHESCLHGSVVNPAYLKEEFILPPYHPDTPEIRSNWVQYYHAMTRMDAWAGNILKKLETDGLADDTIVFYFSDHGGILPRSKRFLYDTGMHVPLIVRFGKNFQYLAPAKPGARVDAPVSFVDIAPSIFSLLGLKIPSYMQGQAFMGPQAAPPRQYVYGFRDRMDERYDMMRAVRDSRYKYIRNYMPHRLPGQHLNYLWIMPATASWEKAFLAGKCNEIQSAFWKPKSPEELYDTQNDPYEISNLAERLEFKETLERLRKASREHLLAIRDTGFLPESEMVRRSGNGAVRSMSADKEQYDIERIVNAAELAAGRDEQCVPALIELTRDKDSAIRYWACVGCSIRGEKAGAAEPNLKMLLKDDSPAVRVAAAEALCWLGHPADALPVLVDSLNNGDALLAINALDALGETARPAADGVVEKLSKGKHDPRVVTVAECFLGKFGKTLPKTDIKK